MNQERNISPTPNADAVEQWLRSIRTSNQESKIQDSVHPSSNQFEKDSRKPNPLKVIGNLISGVFSPPHRYELIMADYFYDYLSTMAKEENCSLAEIVRRAVASYNYLKKEEMAGGQVALTDSSDNIIKKINLP